MSSHGVVVDKPMDGVIAVRLAKPPGNVLDIELCGRLHSELAAAAYDRGAKLLMLAAEGENFSFGASVEEHLPEPAPEMLRAMSAVVDALYSHPYPTLAAVQGRCLGGGLEVALACDMMIVEESAVLAAPEIQLGVFAPAATVLLQSTAPRCVAAEILLTGRDFTAAEALQWGLANRVAADGSLDDAVAELVSTSFAPRSAASLRQATRAFRGACRTRLPERIAVELDRVERQYLEELLALADGSEGIRAFLEKRDPVWEED